MKLTPDQLTLPTPVQFSAAINNNTQQQRYLDAQQQQANQADEEALVQADIGTQAIHQLTKQLAHLKQPASSISTAQTIPQAGAKLAFPSSPHA